METTNMFIRCFKGDVQPNSPAFTEFLENCVETAKKVPVLKLEDGKNPQTSQRRRFCEAKVEEISPSALFENLKQVYSFLACVSYHNIQPTLDEHPTASQICSMLFKVQRSLMEACYYPQISDITGQNFKLWHQDFSRRVDDYLQSVVPHTLHYKSEAIRELGYYLIRSFGSPALAGGNATYKFPNEANFMLFLYSMNRIVTTEPERFQKSLFSVVSLYREVISWVLKIYDLDTEQIVFPPRQIAPHIFIERLLSPSYCSPVDFGLIQKLCSDFDIQPVTSNKTTCQRLSTDGLFFQHRRAIGGKFDLLPIESIKDRLTPSVYQWGRLMFDLARLFGNEELTSSLRFGSLFRRGAQPQ